MSARTPAAAQPWRTGRPAARRYAALLSLLLALGMLVLLPAAGAQAAGGEQIKVFDAQYKVNADGSADVTEKLTWQFPSGASRHGIKRYIITAQG